MGITSSFSVWRWDKWNVHVEGQERNLTWAGMPVGSGKKGSLNDLMALNVLFHSLFLWDTRAWRDF